MAGYVAGTGPKRGTPTAGGCLVLAILAHAEVHLHEAPGAEPGQHQHLVLSDLVLHDLERPRALEGLVQALDDAVALHVVEQAVAPLALADLPGLERFLQQLPVHTTPP